jgi:hypothetical protein
VNIQCCCSLLIYNQCIEYHQQKYTAMFTLKKYSFLVPIALLGALGCSPSRYTAQSGSDVDDLYGGEVRARRAAVATNTPPPNRNANPDFAFAEPNTVNEGVEDYYDESYLSSRQVTRAVSDQAGFNAGFSEGYRAGQMDAFTRNPMWWGMNTMGFGPSYLMGYRQGIRQVSFSLGLGMGFNRFGWGNPWAFNNWGAPGWGWNSWGMDPWGWNSWGMNSWGMNSWGGPMMGWNSWGMDPWGMNPWGMNSWGMGGFYNPWGFNRPVVVINNNTYDNRSPLYRGRTIGTRAAQTAATPTVRSNQTYNNGFVNTPRASQSNGRQSFETPSSRASTYGSYGSDTYARPRGSSSSYTQSPTGRSGVNTSGMTSSRASAATANSYQYARPRSDAGYSSGRSSSSYSSGSNARSSSSWGSSEGSYGTSSRSSDSYSAPSRSQSTYSAPSAPSSRGSSGSYSAPSSSSGGSRGASSAPSASPRSGGPR